MKKTSSQTQNSGNKLVNEPIVFFGTGPVAAASLELLLESFEVEAVITKPKPQGHRGSYPVLELAQAHKISVIEVTDKKDLSGKIKNAQLNSRVGVLIDFGIIVSQEVIDFFPLGIVNSHFSVLPEWRGADPISFAILSGQESTGVSLMLLVEAMDEGPLIGYAEYELNQTETTPILTEALINLSNELIKALLPMYLVEQVLAPQTVTGRATSYSRKLEKADGVLDWEKPAEQLEREIRAYIDWPKSRTILANKDVVITSAEASSTSGLPGTVVANKKELQIYCNKGSLKILRLKPAGKKEMTAEAFLAGHPELLN